MTSISTPSDMPSAASIDPSEVEKFSRIAAEWWDPKGKFGILHKFNPVRLEYIRDNVLSHFRCYDQSRHPFEGLRFLDIGCGGGLLCEPIARLGGQVTGIDPAQKNINTANVHATEQGLKIDYLAQSAEALARKGAQFDVVLNMEVIEHVADVQVFMDACCKLVKPRGLMFVATLNRTLKSFGLAIVGAEYVLGWLPKGTHQWEKFLKPSEIEQDLDRGGLVACDTIGVVFNPLTQEWRRARDTDVNYMMLAEKPGD